MPKPKDNKCFTCDKSCYGYQCKDCFKLKRSKGNAGRIYQKIKHRRK